MKHRVFEYSNTSHSLKRAGNRGFNLKIFEFIFIYGISVRIGNNCLLARVTERQLNKLLRSKKSSSGLKAYIRQNYGLLNKKEIVYDETSLSIITVQNRDKRRKR